jgi:hypothetical protein
MDESWIPFAVLLAFVIVAIAGFAGMVGRAAMKTSARKAEAQAGAENNERYRELAELCVRSQREAAAELARLSERVAAIEDLLRDVG